MKKIAAKWFASYIHQKNQSWIKDPIGAQQRTFEDLITKAKTTLFGKDHNFDSITSYADFK